MGAMLMFSASLVVLKKGPLLNPVTIKLKHVFLAIYGCANIGFEYRYECG